MGGRKAYIISWHPLNVSLQIIYLWMHQHCTCFKSLSVTTFHHHGILCKIVYFIHAKMPSMWQFSGVTLHKFYPIRANHPLQYEHVSILYIFVYIIATDTSVPWQLPPQHTHRFPIETRPFNFLHFIQKQLTLCYCFQMPSIIPISYKSPLPLLATTECVTLKFEISFLILVRAAHWSFGPWTASYTFI